MTLVLAAAVGGVVGATVACCLSWWVLGQVYDQGYRTGLTDRRTEPAAPTRAIRLPRRTR